MCADDHDDAQDVSRLAHELVDAYLAHATTLLIAQDPRSGTLLPPADPDERAPMGRLPKRDGTSVRFNLEHYLGRARDPAVSERFDRSLAAGALLTLGDALESRGYFDRAPELELIRHLRNGIAHGNRFEIRDSKQLAAHPAHNRDARRLTHRQLEITTELNGRVVLFDFLASGDVVAVLRAAADYLDMGRPVPPFGSDRAA